MTKLSAHLMETPNHKKKCLMRNKFDPGLFYPINANDAFFKFGGQHNSAFHPSTALSEIGFRYLT